MVKTAFNPTIADASAVAADVNSGKTFYAGARPKKTGTATLQGTETIEKYADAVIADSATYTPTDPGIFFYSMDIQNSMNMEYYSTGDNAWYMPRLQETKYSSTAVGDGTNFRIKNVRGGNTEYILMRHHYSIATYERAVDEDLANGAQYTPAISGFFSFGTEFGNVWEEFQMTTAGWTHGYAADEGRYGHAFIGDGTNFRLDNESGNLSRIVIMRAKLT